LFIEFGAVAAEISKDKGGTSKIALKKVFSELLLSP
jgi:hypothetical protein